MFSVVRRPNQSSIAPRFGEWDPMSLMENLLRYEPFADLAEARRGNIEQTFAPRFDVKETKDAFELHADLPGVREEDVEISLTGNCLCISGQRSQEEKRDGDNYYMIERSYGSFSRSFTLPDSADTEHINASIKDGVLSLHLPKRAESQPRRVTLNKGTATPTMKKAQS